MEYYGPLDLDLLCNTTRTGTMTTKCCESTNKAHLKIYKKHFQTILTALAKPIGRLAPSVPTDVDRW